MESSQVLAKPPTTLPELLDAKQIKNGRFRTRAASTSCCTEPHPPSYDMCCTNLGNDGFVSNLQLCSIESDRTKLFERAVANTDVYFTCYQAQSLIDVMSLDLFYTMEKLSVMASRMTRACYWRRISSTDQREKRLRETMGPLYDAVTGGSVSGFYSLDLRDPRDKLCARKLCEINNAQSLTSKSSNRSDTSQKGDWSNYRNEFYEGKGYIISAFFADCPIRGRLRFDFVSTRRPKRSTKALSTKRFLSLCKVLGLGELDRVCSSTVDEPSEAEPSVVLPRW